MAEKLLEFVENIKWSNFIYDKEVQVLVSQLRDRIGVLSSQNSNSSDTHRVKLVVVGDGTVGKTSLLISYAKREFPKKYVPTVFDNFTAQSTRPKDGSQVLLQLWDTAGQEDYDRLRPLSYPGADIVLLCFSTVNKSTYESIKEKWYPEVHHYVPDVPIFLIGTKVDLRNNKRPEKKREYDPVTTEEGKKLQNEIKASCYIEVSSKEKINLDKVFEEAIELVISLREKHEANADDQDNERKKKRTCVLL